MPEHHHLVVQAANTVIFTSHIESISSHMAPNIAHHNGSENCHPNLVSGSHKRKLKSSSSSGISGESNNQINSCISKQQQQQQPHDTLILADNQAMVSSALTSPPRKQQIMCSNPKATDPSLGLGIASEPKPPAEMDMERFTSQSLNENGQHGDIAASGNDQGSTPEKTGNWRLKAVLEEFGPDLTPTRQGRVKTLVRAFEKLMSSKKKEEGAENGSKPPQFPLQFTYLNSTEDLARHGRTKEEEEEEEAEEEEGEASVAKEGEDLEKRVLHGRCGMSMSQSEREYSSGAESVKQAMDPQKNPSVLPKSRKAPHLPSQGRKPVDRYRKNLYSSSVPTARMPPQRKLPETRGVQIKARVSKPNPFKLATEERGKIKKEEFIAKLKQIVAEEERLRIPLAQGLPLTTDEPDIPPKPTVKESTVPEDIHLNTDLRAMERAEFDQYISEKLLYLENRRLEEERLRMMAEEEEIRKLRQEMVPKAQMMPYFDRPFRPRRSSKRPTIPKEPQFHHKCWTNNSQS